MHEQQSKTILNIANGTIHSAVVNNSENLSPLDLPALDYGNKSRKQSVHTNRAEPGILPLPESPWKQADEVHGNSNNVEAKQLEANAAKNASVGNTPLPLPRLTYS